MKAPPQPQYRRLLLHGATMPSLTTQVWAGAAIGLREPVSVELRPLHNSVRLQVEERFR